jgi:hypothetical protein
MDANRNRPADEPGGSKVPTTTDDLTRHGALYAAAAAPWWNRFALEQAIYRAVDAGREFSIDELQAEQDLPELGNGTGGVLLRLHKAGVIRRVGYRPSNKASRAGGVVAIWAPGPRRDQHPMPEAGEQDQPSVDDNGQMRLPSW